MNVPKVITTTEAELAALVSATNIFPYQFYYLTDTDVLMYGISNSALHLITTNYSGYTKAEIDTMIGDIETLLAAI